VTLDGGAPATTLVPAVYVTDALGATATDAAGQPLTEVCVDLTLASDTCASDSRFFFF
jgi:hypothetical protein